MEAAVATVIQHDSGAEAKGQRQVQQRNLFHWISAQTAQEQRKHIEIKKRIGLLLGRLYPVCFDIAVHRHLRERGMLSLRHAEEQSGSASRGSGI